MTAPEQLTIANIAALVTVAGALLRSARSIIRMEQKVEILWQHTFGEKRD